jgi:hypothetical protein
MRRGIPAPLCPICKKPGRLVYRSPFSPLVCENTHYFKNIEADRSKSPIYAIVAKDDCSAP